MQQPAGRGPAVMVSFQNTSLTSPGVVGRTLLLFSGAAASPTTGVVRTMSAKNTPPPWRTEPEIRGWRSVASSRDGLDERDPVLGYVASKACHARLEIRHQDVQAELAVRWWGRE